jgi:hypothetical protein
MCFVLFMTGGVEHSARGYKPLYPVAVQIFVNAGGPVTVLKVGLGGGMIATVHFLSTTLTSAFDF